MTDAHAEEHPHPNYWAVFGVLSVLTLVSFMTVQDFWLNNVESDPLHPRSGPILVMLVAVAKATLVAMYFMHLKYDWFKLYFMIVPTLIMGTILMCALLPDMTFSQTRVRMGDAPGTQPPAFGK
jgi:cytochrome c oxidase subunit IV